MAKKKKFADFIEKVKHCWYMPTRKNFYASCCTNEDLEEAAKHYLYGNILYDDVYVGNPTDKNCIEMFKAGAKWQKQQYIKIFEDLSELANHQDGCYALENIQMRLNNLINED